MAQTGEIPVYADAQAVIKLIYSHPGMKEFHKELGCISDQEMLTDEQKNMFKEIGAAFSTSGLYKISGALDTSLGWRRGGPHYEIKTPQMKWSEIPARVEELCHQFSPAFVKALLPRMYEATLENRRYSLEHKWQPSQDMRGGRDVSQNSLLRAKLKALALKEVIRETKANTPYGNNSNSIPLFNSQAQPATWQEKNDPYHIGFAQTPEDAGNIASQLNEALADRFFAKEGKVVTIGATEEEKRKLFIDSENAVRISGLVLDRELLTELLAETPEAQDILREAGMKAPRASADRSR